MAKDSGVAKLERDPGPEHVLSGAQKKTLPDPSDLVIEWWLEALDMRMLQLGRVTWSKELPWAFSSAEAPRGLRRLVAEVPLPIGAHGVRAPELEQPTPKKSESKAQHPDGQEGSGNSGHLACIEVWF